MAWQITISRKASVADTVRLIIRAIRIYGKSDLVKRVYAIMQTPDRMLFLQRIFSFACKITRYKRDPEGHEMIYTPDKAMREGKSLGIDCKKYTTLLASLLRLAGIEPLLKIISYDGIHWEHIYIIVRNGNSYITLDPVNGCRFNSEIPHVKAEVINLNGEKMPDTNLSLLGKKKFNIRRKSGINGAATDVLNNISAITGVGQQEDDITFSEYESLSGIGEMDADEFNEYLSIGRKKLRDVARAVINKATQPPPKFENAGAAADYAAKRIKKRGKIFKNIVDKVKSKGAKIALEPMRGAFLGILLLSKVLAETPIKINLAARLAQAWQKDPQKVKDFWSKFGGDPVILKNIIVKASGQELSGAQQKTLSGIGEPVTLATIGAAIAAATPLLIAASKLLKSLGILKKGDKDSDALDAGADAGEETYEDDGTAPGEEKKREAGDQKGGSFATLSIDCFNDFFAFIFKSIIFLWSFQIAGVPDGIGSIIIISAFFFAVRSYIKIHFKKLFFNGKIQS